MLTLEEIRNIQFTKGLGGYKTSEVDDFVDECIETVEALLNEKNDTTKKLNVLADKLLEYRQEEENIHTALLSAQKMGDAVIREANLKAEQIIKEANEKASQIERIARLEIADEQAQLDKLKGEVADFKAQLLTTYRQHLELISSLPEEKSEPIKEEPVKEEPVSVPTETPEQETEFVDLNNTPIATDEMEDISSGIIEEDTTVIPETPDLSMLNAAKEKEPAPIPVPVRNPRFDDLRFGEAYHIEDDDDDEEDDRKSRKRFKRKK